MTALYERGPRREDIESTVLDMLQDAHAAEPCHSELDSQPAMVERTRTVILVIGTPIDEFMNPSVTVFDRVVDELIPHLQPRSLVVLR